MSDLYRIPNFSVDSVDTLEVAPLAPIVGRHIVPMQIDKMLKKATGKGINVVVIDTGVDTSVTELRDIVNYVDVTGEGKHCPPGVVHATHVATTIKASRLHVGVSPDCNLSAIKALKDFGGGTSRDVAQAVYDAVDMKAHLINMSLGSNTLSGAIKNAIDYARSKGVVVIAAAGNDGEDIDFPGALTSTIAVGAVGHIGDRYFIPKFSSPSSQQGSVDMAAVGVAVKASIPRGENGEERLADLTGTSMAAPIITGIFSNYFEAAGVKDNYDIRELVRASSYVEKGMDPRKIGLGIVQANALLKESQPSSHIIKVHPLIKPLNNFLWKHVG